MADWQNDCTDYNENTDFSSDFNRVDINSIIGNHLAIKNAKRLAQRIVCYDWKKERNPFLDINGLLMPVLFWGIPGTGKSLLIAAIATMISDYCEKLLLNFCFCPLPDNIKSKYQGKSAENLLLWFNFINNQNSIVYAPIDDAEVVFESRENQEEGQNEGSKLLISVFLRNIEGAYAINDGKYLINLASNLPEMIDPAILSRIKVRYKISGAEDVNDFLLYNRQYFQKLKVLGNCFDIIGNDSSKAKRGKKKPSITSQNPRIEQIIHDLSHKHDLNSEQFFAEFYYQLHLNFPWFSLRDCRNINDNVCSRFMDFDLPEDWFENHGLFFNKEYDEKVKMLLLLAEQSVNGSSISSIWLEETILYINQSQQAFENGRSRQINDFVTRLEIEKEGINRFSNKENPTAITA